MRLSLGMNIDLGATAILSTSLPNPILAWIADEGVEGYYLDPTQIGTLFQDEAGTIPVTAVGQDVRYAEDATGNGLYMTNSGGFTYESDAAGPHILADGTGTWTTPTTGFSVAQLNVFLAYKKTTLVANHSTRYTRIYRTIGDKQGLYFDTSETKLVHKNTRVAGSGNRPEVLDTDVDYAIGDSMVVTALAELNGYSQLRVNGVLKDSNTAAGTSFTDMGLAHELLQETPMKVYCMGVTGGDPGFARVVEFEQYMLDLTATVYDFPAIPSIYSHRGFSKKYPEHTVEAYTKAASDGFMDFEADIQPSSDGVLYMYHDTALSNLTDGTGNITEVTSTYLDTLTYPANGESMMRLDDFLTLCTTLGAENICLEIKSTGSQGTAAIDTALSQLTSSGHLAKTILCSFEFDDITYVRSVNSTTPIGYIASSIAEWDAALILAKTHSNATIIASQALLNDDLTRIAAAHDTSGGAVRVGVQVYTTDNIADAIYWQEQGADAVISDYPVYTYNTLGQ